MSKHSGWFVKTRGDRFQGHALDHRLRKYLTETHATYEAAADWAEKMRARILLEQASAAPAPKVSLRAVGDEFLAALKLADSGDHMVNCARILAEAVAAGVGNDLRQRNATVVATRAFLTDLKRKDNGQPASLGTRNAYITCLRAIGNFAVRMEHISDNPFSLVDKVQTMVDLKEVFSLSEIRKLVDPKHAAHPFYPLFCSMIFTGMRFGEAVKLQASWFLWQEERISLRVDKRSRVLKAASTLRTKNRRARVFRLMHEYRDIIKPLVEAAAKSGDGLIFPAYATMPNKTRQDHFNRYVEGECGIAVGKRTPHSTRHTWTCLMLASGENEIQVKNYAGHSEKEMTEHYAKQQELYRVEVTRENWPRGELCFLSRGEVAQAPPVVRNNVIQGPWSRDVSG